MQSWVVAYFTAVKSSFSWRHLSTAALVFFISVFVVSNLPGKDIRLRNETISTAPQPARNAVDAAEQRSVQGLCLVQFSEVPGPEARAVLKSAGVELLQFVPEDAFIARLRGLSFAQVRTLPKVRYVGEYRPEHRVHASLQARVKTAAAATEKTGISVLLAPGADRASVAAARAALSRVAQEGFARSSVVLRGEASLAQVTALANSRDVLWVEPAPRMQLFDEVSSKLVAGDGGSHRLLTQELGYDGTGVTVAVADSGLNLGDAESMHPDLFGRTPAFFFYGGLPDGSDEHSHGTHVAGIIAGNGATGEEDENGALYGLGVAPGASIIGQRLFDGQGGYFPPPSFEKMTRDAVGAGADIGSNSWGDDTHGRYDISAMEFDALVRDADALRLGNQQYILEFSAGNAGPGAQTIGSPAVAKNVIATGASQNDRLDFIIYGDGIDAMADFSSRGPCEDGRIKPDIVAPGTWIASLQSFGATDLYAWSPISENYQYQGGTSQAGPHASGAAAVFVQYYRETHGGATPSPALVKAALIDSAYDLDDSFGTDPVPNSDEGWGAIDLTYLFDPTLTRLYVDQTQLLSTDQVYEQRLVVSSRAYPLNVTLTYTDVPGFPGTIPALVNDLDLLVVGPDGTAYRGNQFHRGESLANAALHDAVNNVEGVRLWSPPPGEYIIRVRARAVVEDSRTDTQAIDQDFALVISAIVPEPREGAIILDRDFYTAPDTVRVTLIDSDLAGRTGVQVTIRSSAENAAETVMLSPTGTNGTFTGSIQTAVGNAAADGRLQVNNGAQLLATYQDVSSGTERTAIAMVDLAPPVLSNVRGTNSFGRGLITWNSNEPANSVVYYGLTPGFGSLNLSGTNSALTTEHLVELPRLASGQTYYYYVVSTDEAGNRATNSNNGAFHSFEVQSAATVLLVDSYLDPFFDIPPLSGYTAALDELGISYEVWSAEEQGEPSFDALSRYRAVIWRVPELFGAWSPTERTAISNYLHTGGGLLVGSMEMLSRLDENGGGAFIRDVLRVQSYVIDPDSTGAAYMTGIPFETVGNGIDTELDYTVYEEIWGGLLGPDISDTLTPAEDASSILVNEAGDTVGIRWPGLGKDAPGRLVLLSFPFDAIPLESGARTAFLRNALSFLAPGAPGLQVLVLDSPSYTIPSLVEVELGDADLARQGAVQVRAVSDSYPAGILVTLNETVTPGLFRGTFVLVPVTSTPGPGELPAKEADTIRVSLTGPQPSVVLSASASVDTIAPTISNIEHEPDYEQAFVWWETSEPADALVQFGESPLLGRTAYNASPSTFHEVRLSGLAPNRTYYYRVVSRDVAGNVRTDDNNGELYTLRTLEPLTPPWSDDMESGGEQWTVHTVEESQADWTLGLPDNGDVSEANSPVNAWGSNLKGHSLDAAESFLLSPALYLTNGNRATLSFSHSYDFTERSEFDIFEMGELGIVTNVSGQTIPLRQFDGASGGWMDEEVDLSPYMGRVIYLVWHYFLFSLESAPRPGWVVDDVAITVSEVAGGRLEVQSNLAQGSFIATGPIEVRGRGLSLVTNVPPGEYVLEFAEVPYYNAPGPQTNTVAAGGVAGFSGTYMFPDSNQNGMSDLWEQQVFGSVSPDRTAATDSDEDGMPDMAEFAAGTSPTDATSNLKLSAIVTGSGLILNWDGVLGRAYRVEASQDGRSWTPLSDWVTSETAGEFSYPVGATELGSGRLLRLVVHP